MKAHTYGLATDDILTPAETRVAAGYCDGLIGKEIAERERISYHTVVRHTQNIYEKTGIRRSTNALVAWFLSRNCGVDVRELCLGITGAFLLAVMTVNTVMYSGSQFVRGQQARRVETARTRCRREDSGCGTFAI